MLSTRADRAAFCPANRFRSVCAAHAGCPPSRHRCSSRDQQVRPPLRPRIVTAYNGLAEMYSLYNEGETYVDIRSGVVGRCQPNFARSDGRSRLTLRLVRRSLRLVALKLLLAVLRRLVVELGLRVPLKALGRALRRLAIILVALRLLLLLVWQAPVLVVLVGLRRIDDLVVVVWRRAKALVIVLRRRSAPAIVVLRQTSILIILVVVEIFRRGPTLLVDLRRSQV